MPARRWLHRRSRRSSQHLSQLPRMVLPHQAGRLLVTWSPAPALGLSDWIEQPQLRTKPTQEEQSATSVEVRQSGGLSHSWKYPYPYISALLIMQSKLSVTMQLLLSSSSPRTGLELDWKFPNLAVVDAISIELLPKFFGTGCPVHPAARRPHTTLNSIKNKPIGQNQDPCKT